MMHGNVPGKLLKASGGGWSKSGRLLVGIPGTFQSMQVDFPDSDNYTVEFGINTSQVPTTFLAPVVAEALITWSVAGNDLTRRVTIGNGVSITGTGQAVKVVMMDRTDLTLAAPPPLGTFYDVSCNVARGTRGYTAQPPALYPVPSFFPLVLPGTGITVPVPQDAGIVSVFVSVFGVGGPPIPQDQVVVRHQLGATDFSAYDPRTFEWVPIHPGTTAINMFNLAGSGDIAQFGIVFGIDG